MFNTDGRSIVYNKEGTQVRSLEEVARHQIRQRKRARRLFGLVWHFETHYDAAVLRSLKPGPVIFAGNHQTPLDMWTYFSDIN